MTRSRRHRLVVAAIVGALAAAGASAALAATSSAPPTVTTQFGYIKSLTPKGSSYVLRLHPAFFLTGSTADAAAVAAGVIKPGEHIDNDYYIVQVPAGIMLAYTVPASAKVTVITIQSKPKKITVKQLAQVLKRTSPFQKTLIDAGKPKFFLGYWLSLKNGVVFSIDQQFQP
jgi:hypothetical protein